MRKFRTILAVVLAASFFLAACGRTTNNGQGAETPTSTVIGEPSNTPTGTVQPAPTATPTPVRCDPSAADYCLSDATFLLQRPIAAPGTDTIDRSYAYGSTSGGRRDPHHGVEFYNASGTPVLAAANGTVLYAGDDKTVQFSPWSNFYGNLVIIEHYLPSQKLYTLYGHLSRIDVITGQTVAAGEKIGEVGASGSAIGSHLHFEVRLDPAEYASTVNPELWLIPPAGTGTLSLRFVDESGEFVQVQASVQYYPNESGTFTQAWQPETYDPSVPVNAWENATLGNLLPGRYRITYLWTGAWTERWVDIQAGELTLAEFIVK